MATINDIAKMAGVSTSTVSHVVNKTRYVSPELVKRVEKAIEELGYKPNLVAKGLASKRTQHVALLVDNLKNPYYCEVLEGAQYAGLILILFLLLYANGNDIYRFFIK